MAPLGLCPPPRRARPRFLSLVFPPGGTKYACESKVVTPSKVDPNCVPTSVVVEKPTGEFGVNLDATGPLELVLAANAFTLRPPKDASTFPGDCQQSNVVFEVGVSAVVGTVNAAE